MMLSVHPQGSTAAALTGDLRLTTGQIKMFAISTLFYAAGFMNVVGLMVFNNCYFTANVLAAELPEVFAVNSQYLVQLWGLAYLATAKRWMHVPHLCFVFFLEKMLYTYFWVDYIADETTRQKLVSMVINYDDVQTGSFLLLFGINDFLFGVVFAYAAWIGYQQKAGKED